MTIAGHTFDVEQEGGPAPLISIDDVVVGEGAGQATFTVSLSPAGAETIEVELATTTGTATELDFGPVLDTLVFDAGETSKPVVIDIVADNLDEEDETFSIGLSSAFGAAIVDGEGLGTITDDDPVPSLAIAGASFQEGFGVRRVSLRVTLEFTQRTRGRGRLHHRSRLGDTGRGFPRGDGHSRVRAGRNAEEPLRLDEGRSRG